MTAVYLVSLQRSLSRIRLVNAEILANGKWVWAQYKGVRHLIGASAFYTLASACRARAGLLIKIVENKYIAHQHWQLHDGAARELLSYRTAGPAAWRVMDLTKK